jgi:hypothetical protein
LAVTSPSSTGLLAMRRPDEADVQAILAAAIDRYVAARHARVDAFVTANYSLLGSLRLHRKALGRDLLRAPANVALAVPYLATRLVASGLAAAGASRQAERLQSWKMFLTTDVARELSWRLYTDLLELPYRDGERGSDHDGLAAEILEASQLAGILDAIGAAAARAHADPVLRERLQRKITTYVEARTAAAELANSVLLAGAGAAVFKQLTPGAMSLGPVLATAIAQHAAIASFPLGGAAGALWYGVFAASPSAALVAGVTGGLLGAGALVTAFAGVLTDPVQRALGVHSRRLHRFVDALGVELKGGRQSFAVRDHYVARIFDLLDLARLTQQLAT